MSHAAYMASNPWRKPRKRQEQSDMRWANWYINRGRFALNFNGGDLRRSSWRRAL